MATNMPTKINWSNAATIESSEFTCGFCDNKVATKDGYVGVTNQGIVLATIHICPRCTLPTLFVDDEQVPGPMFGATVDRLPGQVEPLYTEVRRAMSVSAFTLAVLGCRKILGHVAVDQGAGEGLSFVAYVDYLAEKGFVPPNGKHWVDHIRKKGNEANHEIVMMSQQDAAEIVTFTQMMLTFVYQLPGMIAVPEPPAT